MEELQARIELLAAYEAQAAAKKTTKDQAKPATKASEQSADKDVDHNMDAESSSSEDTSDEAFARTHTIEEERERAKYEGRSPSRPLTSINKSCYQYYLEHFEASPRCAEPSLPVDKFTSYCCCSPFWQDIGLFALSCALTG